MTQTNESPENPRRFNMRNLTILLLYALAFAVVGATTSADAQEAEQEISGASPKEGSEGPSPIPTLREVGSRGFFVLEGPFADFDPMHPSVDIWTPERETNAPVMIYAHGGAGFREDDRARVEMFRRNGFATISFDSYLLNGFDDWTFVTRRVANSGKQDMIWGVFKGAIAYAANNGGWDRRNIFLYGASNGGRVVLYAGSETADNNIRGIISEAPAGTGYTLGDYDIATIIPFGALDTWAGKSETDYVWKRTYPNSPISIEDWVNAQQAIGRPVQFIFFENAGHLLFNGPLELVTVRRGNAIAFTAYQGAADGVLEQYEKDVMSFVADNLVPITTTP